VGLSAAPETAVVYLDDLSPLSASVGYGALGTRGDLGYEHKPVVVDGNHFGHALSSHPPAQLLYRLDGRFRRFHCWVGFNDDVPAGGSRADFLVRTDGTEVGLVADLAAGEGPRELEADVTGATLLELSVSSRRWEHCHAVWLEPTLDGAPAHEPPATITDCLSRAEIRLPSPKPRAKRCIATVVSPGFESLADDMLGSLNANGGCQDALLVVFAVGLDHAVARVAQKHGAVVVACRPLTHANQTMKSIMYSIGHVVDADLFVCLDADMLVLGDLRPVFAALEALPQGAVLACREGNHRGFGNVEQALSAYWGQAGDIERILGAPGPEGAYPIAVNDGCFGGSRTALLALDEEIRRMPGAIAWVDERRNVGWRNQFVFNLALARLQAGVELDSSWNVQLHAQDVELDRSNGRVRAGWQGRPVNILHLSGRGRFKHRDLHGSYARVADPLPRSGGGDGYSDFVAAVRAYAGSYGTSGLTWSFYGTADAQGARVPDPSTFPVFALLHYLVRANGCVRVVETGTACGLSAACLASAVAHRPGGRVVTLDVAEFAERTALWSELPEPMRSCIEARQVDSVAGLQAALDAGERYDAALLDSLHEEEHVWREFEVARKLVCEGGLILIHDPCLPSGTVGPAVERIEAAGYGAIRLFTAVTGVPEEDGLGLAVIENRRRNGSSAP
jgi:predicted O-methyltransferase YrrM